METYRKDAFVELGVEIKKENLPNEFDVFLAVPFAMNVVGKYSLHNQLAIADNRKLIFNDTMTNQHPIDLRFTERVCHRIWQSGKTCDCCC